MDMAACDSARPWHPPQPHPRCRHHQKIPVPDHSPTIIEIRAAESWWAPRTRGYLIALLVIITINLLLWQHLDFALTHPNSDIPLTHRQCEYTAAAVLALVAWSTIRHVCAFIAVTLTDTDIAVIDYAALFGRRFFVKTRRFSRANLRVRTSDDPESANGITLSYRTWSPSGDRAWIFGRHLDAERAAHLQRRIDDWIRAADPDPAPYPLAPAPGAASTLTDPVAYFADLDRMHARMVSSGLRNVVIGVVYMAAIVGLHSAGTIPDAALWIAHPLLVIPAVMIACAIQGNAMYNDPRWHCPGCNNLLAIGDDKHYLQIHGKCKRCGLAMFPAT